MDIIGQNGNNGEHYERATIEEQAKHTDWEDENKSNKEKIDGVFKKKYNKFLSHLKNNNIKIPEGFSRFFD